MIGAVLWASFVPCVARGVEGGGGCNGPGSCITYLLSTGVGRQVRCHMYEGRHGQGNTRKQRRICNEQLLYGNAGIKTGGGGCRKGRGNQV